jgi:putative transcription factor
MASSCDLCGSSKLPFYTAKVEGVSMTVCERCKTHASDARLKSVEAPRPVKKNALEAPANAAPQRKEIMQLIRPDYAARIKRAREKLGIKQEDFAKIIAEKDSMLHNLESGKHEPSLDLARKLEHHLHISLVMQYEENGAPINAKHDGPLTIGDLIKRR